MRFRWVHRGPLCAPSRVGVRQQEEGSSSQKPTACGGELIAHLTTTKERDCLLEPELPSLVCWLAVVWACCCSTLSSIIGSSFGLFVGKKKEGRVDCRAARLASRLRKGGKGGDASFFGIASCCGDHLGHQTLPCDGKNCLLSNDNY